MELYRIQPEQLFPRSWLPTYEKEIRAIWWQLVQLNSNLLILDKIVSFPFNLLQISITPFWHFVYAGLFETSVMIIWRLVDTNRKTLSFPNFKKELIGNMHKEYLARFERVLKSIDFNNTVSRIRCHIKEIRDNQLAHFNREWIVKPPTSQALNERRLSLSELKKMRDALSEIFRVFSFGTERLLILLEYTKGPTDVEELLDNIAKQSHLLNMPERQPGFWHHFRERLSQQQLETFNRYRRKFGLPEA